VYNCEGNEEVTANTFTYVFDRMTNPNNKVLVNSLQKNGVEYIPVHSVNQNSLVVNPKRSQEIVSAPPSLENVEGQKGLVDDIDPELMAIIMAKVIKKLRGFGSEKDEKENNFFDRVVK